MNNLHNLSDLELGRLAHSSRHMPGEDVLADIEAKRTLANTKFGQLRRALAQRSDVQPQLQDLEGKIAQATALLGRLRYSMEYRHELKRIGLSPDQVRALIPSRSTPFGAKPAYVVGAVDQNGQQHIFTRPVRVSR